MLKCQLEEMYRRHVVSGRNNKTPVSQHTCLEGLYPSLARRRSLLRIIGQSLSRLSKPTAEAGASLNVLLTELTERKWADKKRCPTASTYPCDLSLVGHTKSWAILLHKTMRKRLNTMEDRKKTNTQEMRRISTAPQSSEREHLRVVANSSPEFLRLSVVRMRLP